MSFFKGGFSKKCIVKTFNGNRILKFDKSDYDATFDIANAGFRMVGIRLINKDSSRERLVRNVFFLLEFVNVFIAMTLVLMKMIETAINGSFVDLFTMMPCVGYLILSSVKSYKIFYNRPVYENLITELRDMWPKDAVTEKEYKIVRSELTRLKRIVKGYMFCNVALFIMFASPAFVCKVKRNIGYDIPLQLSFSYWLPFDPIQRGRFEVIAVIQTWQCFLTITFITASDILFCVFLSHITTQFDLLAVRIKKIFYVPIDHQLIETYPLGINGLNCTDDPETFSANELEKTYKSNLVDIIIRHRALIRLSGDVENQFTFSLLINFINSSIIICFCGFCCVFLEKWHVVNYKLFLTTATLQVWLLCWYGQKLQDSSEGIADAIYSSGWYNNVSQNIKSSLIIILYRARNVVCITTYGFSVVSISSYSTILKTSWSYLMLLVNVFKQ